MSSSSLNAGGFQKPFSAKPGTDHIRGRISGGTRRLYHHQVGELELHYENLHIAGTDGQTLIIYHGDPGSRTAQALELLATLAENRSPSSAPTEKTGTNAQPAP